MEQVDIRDDEYERVRADPNHFVLKNADHIAPGAEKVVEEHGRFVIAEKIQAREISESRDPRNLVKSCRIVVADDVVEVRILLKMLVQMEPDCTIVAEAGTGREAIAACQQAQPGVVVLDLEMPEGNGYDVLPEIVESVPGVRVIIFSGSGKVDYRTLAGAGAYDVVPKGGDTTVIMGAIRRAAHATDPGGDGKPGPFTRD